MSNGFQISQVTRCGAKVFVNNVEIGRILRWTEEGCAVRLHGTNDGAEPERCAVRGMEFVHKMLADGVFQTKQEAAAWYTKAMPILTDTIIVSNDQFEKGIYTVEILEGK